MGRIANAAFLVALAVWVGGLLALSLVAAPIVFKTAGSRQLAGTIFGTILRTFTWVELTCAVLAAAGFALARPTGGLDWARGALLGLMIALLLAYAFGVNPAIAELRPQCGSFDRDPADDAERSARLRFDTLHAWSVRLVGANILAGLALLALTALRRP